MDVNECQLDLWAMCNQAVKKKKEKRKRDWELELQIEKQVVCGGKARGMNSKATPPTRNGCPHLQCIFLLYLAVPQ